MKAGVFKHDCRNTHPLPLAGAGRNFEVERRNRLAADRTTLNAALSRAYQGAERAFALEDVVAGSVQNIGCSIAEQAFGGRVPKTNLALKRYDERRISGPFKELVYIRSEHIAAYPGIQSLRHERRCELPPLSHTPTLPVDHNHLTNSRAGAMAASS